MTIDEMKVQLEKELSPRRFTHSLNVMLTAVRLAKDYNEDGEKAAVAGLLHDCARNIRGAKVFELCEKYGIMIDEVSAVQPELLHGPLGSRIAGTVYGIEDKAVLEAIGCHTTGKYNMGLLDKIIFIADYIEPGRKFKGVEEVRKAARKNLDLAVLMALDKTILHVVGKKALIHTDTVKARNYIIRANGEDLRRI